MIDELWNYECRITNAKLCLAHFDIRNSAFETSPRPYQVYAVKHMVTCINDDNGNGYIWHTTGSGKTLTSFKAATLLKENEHIHKCVFVVDRKAAFPGQLSYRNLFWNN